MFSTLTPYEALNIFDFYYRAQFPIVKINTSIQISVIRPYVVDWLSLQIFNYTANLLAGSLVAISEHISTWP